MAMAGAEEEGVPEGLRAGDLVAEGEQDGERQRVQEDDGVRGGGDAVAVESVGEGGCWEWV